ncbi:hypothetical protein K2173_004033 [Erythroxylum novogranatense]|uniref:Secreted protein n=1 Tax=Erythroxylum novogranatense TaxID=1862640 RepID=A0AAV8SJK5_9ROSI|nr:hypothetical protein K2173_004033 [Erythroxylum novogranatense]
MAVWWIRKRCPVEVSTTLLSSFCFVETPGEWFQFHRALTLPKLFPSSTSSTSSSLPIEASSPVSCVSPSIFGRFLYRRFIVVPVGKNSCLRRSAFKVNPLYWFVL